MTERKPPGTGWETWIDEQIRSRPDADRLTLVQEASRRFDLTPLDEDFLVREIARLPELRIEWIRSGLEPAPTTGSALGDSHAFARALAATPHLGLPGSDFVFPTVHQVDNGGAARSVIATRSFCRMPCPTHSPISRRSRSRR